MKKPLRVLMVEDSEDDVLLMIRELKKGGYEPESIRVESGEAMGAALKEKTWDAILCDYQMPKFNGLAAIALLKETGIDIPLIIVSGAIGEEMAVECMRSGAHDYVMKGNLSRLVPVIERELKDAESRRQRKKAEEALRKSEEMFRELVETINDMFYELDEQGMILYASPSVERIFGYSQAEMLGRSIGDFLDRGETVPAIENIRKVMDGDVVPHEYRARRKSGEIAWIRVSSTPVKQGDRVVGVRGILSDITDRRRAEEELRASREQLRALAARLQAVREEARTRIARQIHDELGGALTGLKIDLSLLTKAALEIEDASVRTSLLARIDSIIESIDATIHAVRSIAMELRPGVLDDLGLVAALEWQLKDFEKRTGIGCELIPPWEELSLDTDCSTALFRIFQEALTNVARHSGATGVCVRLRAGEGVSVLEIEDNGKGIEKEEILSHASLGFLGMRERAQMFGGSVTVSGISGRGTKVRVEVPSAEKRKMERDQGGAG
jgi:two-component system sensor histidine kinase UhpB